MSNLSIVPNASKTIQSLRHLTYTNVSALADIVDNSLDAGADNVNISISDHKNGQDQDITIVDNGHGMSIEIMGEAIKLGSATEKGQSDLGRFGMGLVTASISMARRVEVVSKEDGKPVYKVVLDLDDIADSNEWNADLENPTENEAKLLENLGSGTIISLKKVDTLQWKNPSTLIGKVEEGFAEIFRHYIAAGKSIAVNGKELKASDPLELARGATEIMFDDEISFKDSKIQVKFVLLEHTGNDEARERGYTLSNQGVYVVRNLRQIARGSTLDLFTRHNDFNRVRVEVGYSQELDDYFGINFTKNELIPSQALVDKLKENLNQFFLLARRRAKTNQAVDASKKLDHKEAEDVISRKSKLLKTKNVMEKRAPRTNTGEPRKEPVATKKRENIRKFQQGGRSVVVKFGEVDLGETGDLYQSDFEGTMMVINWNISHPFHAQMVAQYSGDKRISLPLDFFLFSLVTAELSVSNEDNLDMIQQIKSTLSTNLRVLMR